MTDQFGVFPADLEADIRRHIARYCDIEDAASSASWALFGVQVTFFRDAWIGYMQRPRIGDAAPGTPFYFVVQTRRRQKVRHLIPIANTPGSIDRVNAVIKISVTRDNFLQYLRFYYTFTPVLDRVIPTPAD